MIYDPWLCEAPIQPDLHNHILWHPHLIRNLLTPHISTLHTILPTKLPVHPQPHLIMPHLILHLHQTSTTTHHMPNKLHLLLQGTGTAVYAKVYQESGNNQGLVAAKARLAKKGQTIPRPKIVAAHMAANVVDNARNALRWRVVQWGQNTDGQAVWWHFTG